MQKFYKVIKENFLWEVGAIIENKSGDSDNCKVGYEPVDVIFCKHEEHDEYISSSIVENSTDYFERVYPVSLLTKTVYKTKEQAKEMIAQNFRE